MALAETPKRILAIDDDPDVLDLLRTICRSAGLEIREALDGRSGIQRALECSPDLVLLDLSLPDMDGLDVLRELRTRHGWADIPIVMLSARRTVASRVTLLDAGADDYIVKPFDIAEVDARIRSCLRRRALTTKLERKNLELRLSNERLNEEAGTDHLTGLANARRLREVVADEFLRAERYETPLSLVMVDLDGFKAVNDVHGHPAGDRLLSLLAQRLQTLARSTDIVARYGGDEFAIVLPHTGSAEALLFAQRVCRRFDQAPVRLADGSASAVRLSCGVATYADSRCAATADELIEQADAALYRAKAEGGNSVVSWDGTHAGRRGHPASSNDEMPRSDQGAGAV